MAEFCLDCWNKLNDAHYTEREFILSDDLDLCEGCGEWKQVIVVARQFQFLYDLKHIFDKSKER